MPTRNRLRSLSLPLILGAGLALAGCGDDDSSTATPAPAPAPTTPPAPPAPDPVGVPGGLKITATGSDFLEFGWEAVEGATGYEIQLSLKEGDWASVATATVTTTMHRFTVAAEKTGYARVRAHEGDRQGAWSETATGTSMAAPLVLSAPAPRVKGAGPDYIEWEWDAVADAESYQVRVAATREGLDAASPETVSGTTHRVDAEPEMEMYLRVRAAAGPAESPVVSDWSDAVAGMSEAAPMPFVVSMRPPEAGADSACSGQAFCPDDGTDPKKAMASVNPRMLVTSSHPARITPRFVDGSAGISVDVAAGEDETPFTYADNWDALQAAVVGEGATFEFRRLTVGAGQEAAPAGEARFITCGPFRCSEAAAEAPAAPQISIADTAVCEEFAVDFRLVPGAFENFDQVYKETASQGAPYTQNRRQRNAGLDFGWSYTLSHPATVTHEWPDLKADTPTGTLAVPGAPLEVTSTYLMLNMAPAPSADSRVNKFGPERNQDSDRLTRVFPGPIRNGSEDCLGANFHSSADNPFNTYPSLRRSRGVERPEEFPPLRRPEGPDGRCARIVTDGYYYPVDLPVNQRRAIRFIDHLSSYLLHVDPQVGVSWAGSEVAWGKDDPFADLQCERVTFRAAEQYDKCERFEEEVEAFWGDGIVPRAPDRNGIRGRYRLEFEFSPDNNRDNTNGRFNWMVVRTEAPRPYLPNRPGNDQTPLHRAGQEWRPRGSRHASMWLQRAEAGIPEPDRDRNSATGFANLGIDGTFRDFDLYRMWGVDIFNANWGWAEYMMGARDWRANGTQWNPVILHDLHDSDGDPIYGDLGKIDMVGADGNPGRDGDPENYDGNADADRCSAEDGGEELCDAVVDIPLSLTFVLIRDTRTCETEIDIPLTCTWDADGDRRRGGDTTFPAGPFTNENGGNYFIECEVN